MTTTIRDVRADDAQQIVDIYAPYVLESAISFEVTPPGPEEILLRIGRADNRLPWLVMERDDVICGYAYATTFRSRKAYENTAETTVYVRQNFRRQRVGLTLMQHLLSRLQSTGLHIAIAGITLPNPASVALHERLGFESIGVFPQVGRKFDEWHDVGFWSLKLNLQH